MSDILRGYRIGFQGEYTGKDFVFKARHDAEIIVIDESVGVIPEQDSNRLAQVLMLRFIDKYLRELAIEKPKCTLNAAISIILRLIEKNRNSHIFWDSMGCSTRVLKLLYIENFLIPKYKDEISANNIKNLRAAIKEHSDVMVEMNMPSTNHGLQGLHALVGLASSGYLNKSVEVTARNLVDRFSAMFNSEGFYLENSSEYHFYACQLLEDFESSGWYESSGLKELLLKARKFFPLLFASPGEVFSFGDTDRTLIKNQCKKNGRIKLDADEIQYGIFERSETGLVVSRFKSNEGSYSSVCLTNQFHNYTHNHHDYMSFEWYFCNQWIVVDPGKYTYDKGDLRNWFYSDSAHNTLNLSLLGHRFEASRKCVELISDRDGNGIFASVDDENFSCRRVLSHKQNSLIVKDRISLFNKVDNPDGLCSSILLDRSFTELKQLSETSLRAISDRYELIVVCNSKLRFSRGELDPISGWQAPQYGIKEKSWQIFIPLVLADGNEYESTLELELIII